MKRIFTAFIVMLFAIGLIYAQAPSIILLTPDDRDDDQYQFLINQGFDVEKFWGIDDPEATWSIADAGQEVVDMLNAADLIIVGRSPQSGNFQDSADVAVWNGLTAPMIINSPYLVRSTRLKMFNSSSAYHLNEEPALGYGLALDPADPVFANVTLDGDSLAWWFAPNDFIENRDSANNGTIVATYKTSPLIVRWDAGTEYYPGGGAIPAGPRVYFGMGNDALSFDDPNFFPLTKGAKAVYLAEIQTMLGIPVTEPVFGPTDQRVILLTPDNRDDLQYNFLVNQGFKVTKFWGKDDAEATWSIAEAGQDTVDILNAADLIVVGRSPQSGNFQDSADVAIWNGLTPPLVINSPYLVRSTRLKMFNSSSAYHLNDEPALGYGLALDPADPVFADVTLDGDSLAWWFAPNDFIENNDSANNGTIVATYKTSPLIVRWDAGTEYYPGGGAIPAGPRVYFGMGNDALSYDDPNFFPLTRDAKVVYLAELCRMVGIDAPAEVKFSPSDFTITFIAPNENDDPQIAWLEKNGIKVNVFYPGDALSEAGQDTIDMLNASDLIIHGRSPSSSTSQPPNREPWNNLTAPMIQNSQYFARNSRLNWFNSGTAYHMNDGPEVAYGVTAVPDDPVFTYVDLMEGDSVAWCLPPHDFLQNADSATNGEIIASYDMTNPLLARFEAGVEFYPGSVDMPAGPRTYFGFGNDATSVAGSTFVNFFPLTAEAQQIYLNEISLMLGAEMVEVIPASTDASLASLEYDVVTATLTPEFDADSMMYMLQLVQDSSVVALTATPASDMATVVGDSTIDVSSGDTITTMIVVTAENGNVMAYEVTVYPFASDVSVQPNEVEGPGIKLYPNPASDMIYIEAGAEISQVTVYNAVGRVVMDQTYRNNPQVDLNVGSLIPGLYMIKVDFDKDQSTMVKLLKR